MLDQNLFMWWDVNFLLIYLGLSWVGLKWSCSLYGLCKWGPNGLCKLGSNWLTCLLPHQCPCQHPCGAMSSPLSMSLLHHWSCQITHHHCYPHHRHVSSHVIFHVIIVWHDNWICDENYTVRDVNFRHRKRAWIGLRGPGDIPWRF